MRRSSLLKVIGSIAVLVLSFLVTTSILDTQQSDLPPGPITVVEATYGFNCEGSPGPAESTNHVPVGNATKAVAEECNGAMEECAFVITIKKLGDPAPGCIKDFSARWRCGNAPAIQQARRPKPADDKSITLKCVEE